MTQLISVVAYDSGHDVTARATGAITAGRLVTVASTLVGGNIAVKSATAGSPVFGVSRATVGTDELVPITRGASRIVRLIAGTGGVAFNAEVESDANGAVVTATTGAAVGRAVSSAAAAGEVLVSLYA